MSTPIGIAHLTLLRLSPPELVTIAAEAGYDFVGIRVKAITEGEHQYPMQPGSPMSRETLRRLDDTGLTVRDIEFLTLRPDTGPDDWQPALEAVPRLASTFSVVGVDDDPARLTDTLARLTADGASYGIRPTLEPIGYQPVSRVADAAAIARATGAAVLLDALHIQRGGSSLDDVRALEPELVPCIQLCDGPLAVPQTLELPAELPLGMTPTAPCCRSRPGCSARSSARAVSRSPSCSPRCRPRRRSASRCARPAAGPAVRGGVRHLQPARRAGAPPGGHPCLMSPGRTRSTCSSSAPARAVSRPP